MNALKHIITRELSSYFSTPLAYVFIVILLVLITQSIILFLLVWSSSSIIILLKGTFIQLYLSGGFLKEIFPFFFFLQRMQENISLINFQELKPNLS